MRDDALKDERSSLHAALPPDSGHTADNKRLTSKTKPNTAQETLKKSLWPDNSVTWVNPKRESVSEDEAAIQGNLTQH